MIRTDTTEAMLATAQYKRCFDEGRGGYSAWVKLDFDSEAGTDLLPWCRTHEYVSAVRSMPGATEGRDGLHITLCVTATSEIQLDRIQVFLRGAERFLGITFDHQDEGVYAPDDAAWRAQQQYWGAKREQGPLTALGWRLAIYPLSAAIWICDVVDAFKSRRRTW